MTMTAPSGAADMALSIRGLSKRFGGTNALSTVDLDLRRGTVHALLGHNGSGKSTLIKLLGGYHVAEAGSITVNGEPMPLRHTASDSDGAGIRFVYQDLGLIGSMSVAENMAMGVGYATSRVGSIVWRTQYREARRQLRRLNTDVDPRDLVHDLGPVEQTMLAIGRALQGVGHHRGILVLDEPTARLPQSEVVRLLEIVRALKADGVSIIYVTHRLDEVFEIADDITILQAGEVIFSGAAGTTNERQVGNMIAGRSLDDATPPRPVPQPAGLDRASAVVQVSGLSGRRVRSVDFEVQRGEMLVIIGLVGSGRSELGRLIFGLQPITEGTVRVGDAVPRSEIDPRWAAQQGMAYVPQQRDMGLVLGESIAENLALTSLKQFLRRFAVRSPLVNEMARGLIKKLGIVSRDERQMVNSLSGGNQQKVALGKWIRNDLKLIIMDEPLQGIDIGAKIDILRSIRSSVLDRGGAAIWLESDIEFVPDYADRVLVMRDGCITHELTHKPISLDEMMMALYGTVHR